jgi:hypothetical protein
VQFKFLGPPIESATYSVNMYTHETTEPDNSLPTAGGIVRIRAPIDVAVSAATEYKNIYELNPYIEQSVVVAKSGDTTDVYIKVPTVIEQYVWAVVRFRPVPTDRGFAFRGDMIDGNLEDLRIFFRFVPVDGNETLGQFELLADPALPLPQSWVARDTKDGVHIMLERFRWKVEARVPGHQRRFEDEVDFDESVVSR